MSYFSFNRLKMHYNDVHAILSFSHAYFPTLPTLLLTSIKISFRHQKKLRFQEPFHILERGNPVERGNQFLKGGTKKWLHTMGSLSVVN